MTKLKLFFRNNNIAISTLIILSIFIIDYFTPLGMAIGVLYVTAMVCLINEPPRIIYRFAIALSILILSILIFRKEISWMVLANRIISIITIWTTALTMIRLGINKKTSRLNNELTAKNKEINDLIKIVAHDLKNPIHNITNLSELLTAELTKDKNTNKQALEYVNYIDFSAFHLNDITTKILENAILNKKEKLTTVNFHKLITNKTK